MNKVTLCEPVREPEFVKQIQGKRIGVVLSSGFFGFWAHAGFVKAMEEFGIDPVAYSGCSSGAIVAAFKAAGMGNEEIIQRFDGLKTNMFWDPDETSLVLHFITHGLKGFTGILRGSKFRGLVYDSLPVKKFKKCKKGLYIVATNLSENRREVFKEGDIAKAVHASGAVPLMFRSVKIKGQYFVDGGLVDKAPVRALAENEELDGIIVHYIPSRSLKKKKKNWFMKKKFTPWYVYNHSYNIMRHQDFVDQVKWARERGLDIWVVSPSLPRLGPFKLEEGRRSLDLGYKNMKKTIKTNDFLTDDEILTIGR